MVMTNGGPVLVHNCDQAMSRDLLAHGMRLAEDKGMRVIGHIHDELITMVPDNSPLGLPDLIKCMTTPPAWAPDLLLGADGYESRVYRKG